MGEGVCVLIATSELWMYCEWRWGSQAGSYVMFFSGEGEGGGKKGGEEGGSQLVDYVMFSVGWGVGVGCVRGWGVIISLLCKTTCPTLITTPLKRLLSFLD